MDIKPNCILNFSARKKIQFPALFSCFTLHEKNPVHFAQKAGWNPQMVWTWSQEKSFSQPE
jgi:hypothetical protein